jgi:hypothetical protein
MSLRRVCDRCGLNEAIAGDSLPEGWLRLLTSENTLGVGTSTKFLPANTPELCKNCKAAFRVFLDEIRMAPKVRESA